LPTADNLDGAVDAIWRHALEHIEEERRDIFTKAKSSEGSRAAVPETATALTASALEVCSGVARFSFSNARRNDP
jgi:hypothetical protein